MVPVLITKINFCENTEFQKEEVRGKEILLSICLSKQLKFILQQNRTNILFKQSKEKKLLAQSLRAFVTCITIITTQIIVHNSLTIK